MRHGNMKWLVWKEYRQNRLIVLATLFLLAAPYVILSWVFWKWGGPSRTAGWQECLLMGGLLSLYVSQLVMPMIGGNVIACERADRSAEFQAYLPIPRSKILTAKLLLVLALVALIWLPDGSMILYGTLDAVEPVADSVWILCRGFATVAIVGLTSFCVAWLLSSFLQSATISACAGIVAPIIAFFSVFLVARLCEIPEISADEFVLYGGLAICLPLAPICFAIGTWLYLRRVEP